MIPFGDMARAEKQMAEMHERGWAFRVFFDFDGAVDDISGWAGDPNCHHRKEYDPKDGHGFSTFDTDQDVSHEEGDGPHGPVWTAWLELTGEDGVSFSDAIDFAHKHIMAIEPGAKL